MSRKFVTLVALVLVLAIGFLAPMAHAFDCGKGKAGWQGGSKDCKEKIFLKAHKILKNKEELGLSDEQVQKIKDLKISAKKDLIRKEAEIDILKVDIKSEMYKDTIDVAAVNAFIDKKYDLKKEKTKSLIAAFVALKNILTEDQKKKLKEIYGKSK